MVKKGQKLDEQQLLKLAEARKAALAIRQEKAQIKKDEKELAGLERKEKGASLKKSLASKKSKKQEDHETGYAENVVLQHKELEEEPTEEIEEIVRAKPKKQPVRRARKVRYVEEELSSEEEVVYKEARKSKPQQQSKQEISQEERDAIIQQHYADQEAEQQEAQRLHYLEQAQNVVQQMPVRGGIRTNLFGGWN